MRGTNSIDTTCLRAARLSRVVLDTDKGADFCQCCIEAASFALAARCNVTFTFNGKTYQFLFNDLIAAVQEKEVAQS